ncbi:hypothetical protein XENTR_v10001002 [Xenopus tropicalis]|uniref:Amelotin n=1 Tax=Xenopus tropicalis TaxID=8364 RepID=A0A7D9NJU3_XENTR|nr:uncharacterized protein LOC105946460 precursor [Xenopus tropicalis]AIS76620.1 amelotin [Xenopus tropicalis]KAE8630883.1 hypothetical protein XENTR_v10001002 [Xenopus tropicalis]|eukprot:NP_001297037.1 uncharacterized protein LOC105946460 precursor [Xenopus tropicalis]
MVMFLLLCLLRASLGFPMLHLMQMFNLLGRVPEQSQRIPHLFVAPSQLVQLHGTQLRYMHPFQMSPIMFAQLRQQALSGSDSEENVLPGVIMIPLSAGLDENIATVHQAGVIIDNSILQEQPVLNPAGQHGVSTAIQNKILPELPWVIPTQAAQNDVSVTGIIKGSYTDPLPTNTPDIDLNAPEPTMSMGRDNDLTVNAHTMGEENWILCNSYVPDLCELHNIVRGDGYIPIKTPVYFKNGQIQGNRNTESY